MRTTRQADEAPCCVKKKLAALRFSAFRPLSILTGREILGLSVSHHCYILTDVMHFYASIVGRGLHEHVFLALQATIQRVLAEDAHRYPYCGTQNTGINDQIMECKEKCIAFPCNGLRLRSYTLDMAK